MALKLAWYESSGFGVLGPRGWYCFGVYGSGGSSLWLSPQPLTARNFFPGQFTFDGPFVSLAHISGQTSGRDIVAQVIARVFPAHRVFVSDVLALFDRPASALQYGPWPSDRLRDRSREYVEYTTPGNTEGLGSGYRVGLSPQPIRGFAYLELPGYDLLHLRVRLPAELDSLAPVIIRQAGRRAHRESGKN